jgi:2-C-methyl-D-erythritol 2,4-cyclodiphosphate synthase
VTSHRPLTTRIGHGYDAHQLTAGRKLILGGVEVPHDRGLAGHSDGDALTHAIIDALLGAAALGDIGQHFPGSDASLEGISSLVLLGRIAALLKEHGWQPGNVDATIVAQNPKLAPHIPEMRRRLAQTLQLELHEVSVKATTTDRMGFPGREEGIAAFAVATIVPSPAAGAERPRRVASGEG